MRSPLRQRYLGACAEAVPALLEKHGFPRADEVVADDRGWVNLCFFAGDVVVRFNARDPHLAKFRREKIAYETLRERGLPVPAVVVLDDDRDLVPFDVLITERLPGRNLEVDLPGLPTDQRETLIRASADILQQVHTVRFSGFGDLAEGTPHSTWRSAYLGEIERHVSEAREACAFDPDELDRFRRFVDRNATALDDVKFASLVHSDFHPGNLLHDGQRITGLLDFEWSFAGDADFDLAYQDNLDGMGFAEDFFAHFPRQPDPRRDRRRMLYRLWRNLELCNVAKLHFSAAEATEYRETALAALARWETLPSGHQR